jgi:hypothetical protein
MIKYAIFLAVVLALAAFAHLFSLWVRWSRLAMLRRGRIRPALPLRYRLLDPREHSVFLGRAQYGHGLRHLTRRARARDGTAYRRARRLGHTASPAGAAYPAFVPPPRRSPDPMPSEDHPEGRRPGRSSEGGRPN